MSFGLRTHTPLHEFCKLARGGQIPQKEVKRLVSRYSREAPAPVEALEKVLDLVEKIAKKSGDKQIVAKARIIIAGFGFKKDDLEKAFEAISSIENENLIAQLLFSLAKTLVEVGKINQAWQTVAKNPNTLLRTESMLIIACASGTIDDFCKAEASAKNINSIQHRDDTLIDIKECQKDENYRKEFLSLVFTNKSTNDVALQLIRFIIEENGFDSAYKIAARITDHSRLLEFLKGMATELGQQI